MPYIETYAFGSTYLAFRFVLASASVGHANFSGVGSIGHGVGALPAEAPKRQAPGPCRAEGALCPARIGRGSSPFTHCKAAG